MSIFVPLIPYIRIHALTGTNIAKKNFFTKLKDKKHFHHTGYIGGLKSVGYDELLSKHSDEAVKLAVKGMLPKNTLGAKMLKKLKVYKDANHENQAQKPVEIKIEGARN